MSTPHTDDAIQAWDEAVARTVYAPSDALYVAGEALRARVIEMLTTAPYVLEEFRP